MAAPRRPSPRARRRRAPRASDASVSAIHARRPLFDDTGATLDDLREAVTTLEDAERIARRVLGGAHPATTLILGASCETREPRSAPAKRRRRGVRKSYLQYTNHPTPRARRRYIYRGRAQIVRKRVSRQKHTQRCHQPDAAPLNQELARFAADSICERCSQNRSAKPTQDLGLPPPPTQGSHAPRTHLTHHDHGPGRGRDAGLV